MLQNDNLYTTLLILVLPLLTFGLAFPYGVPIFTPVVFVLFMVAIMSNKIHMKINIGTITFLAMIIMYLWGLYLNEGVLYTNNIKDLKNILILILVYLTFGSLTNVKYKQYKVYIHLIIAITTILISIFSLFKLYLLTNGIKLNFLYNQDYYPAGTSLVSDYNMFSLSLLIGIISVFFLIIKTKQIFYRYILIFMVIISSSSVLLSNSRRGILVLILLLVILTILSLKKLDLFKGSKNKVIIGTISISLITIITFIISKLSNEKSGQFILSRVLNRSLGVFRFSESLSSRTTRWDSSMDIIDEFDVLQKIAGDGFKYLDILGGIYKPGLEEYPHNMLISTFLYSGLIGTIILVLLFIFVLYRIITNYKTVNYDMTLFFFTTLIFMSVSGNSFFTSRLLGIIIIIILISPGKEYKFERTLNLSNIILNRKSFRQMNQVLMIIKTTGLKYDDRLRKECLSIEKLGHQSEILVLEDENIKKEGKTYGNVNFKAIRLLSRKLLPRKKFLIVKTLEIYLKFLWLIILRKPQIVWIHNMEKRGIIPILFIFKKTGLINNIVWDQHELPNSKYFNNNLSFLINLCDSVVVANKERYDLLTERITINRPDDFFILENFPDKEFTQLPVHNLPLDVINWLEGKDYILAQGGANPNRNLEPLIKAIIESNNLKLIVVGPYNTAEKIKGFTEKYGEKLNDSILFTGAVPQFEMVKFIDQSYASIILYDTNNLNRTLCAPNRLYQAICRGAPVIVGSNPPMKNLLEKHKNGIVLKTDGNDYKDIMNGFKQLALYYDLILKSSKKLSQEFTWESQHNTIFQIISRESNKYV